MGETSRIKFLKPKKVPSFGPKRQTVQMSTNIFYGPVGFMGSDGDHNFELTKDEYKNIYLAYIKKNSL